MHLVRLGALYELPCLYLFGVAGWGVVPWVLGGGEGGSPPGGAWPGTASWYKGWGGTECSSRGCSIERSIVSCGGAESGVGHAA